MYTSNVLPIFIKNQIDCQHCAGIISEDTDDFFIKLREKAIKQVLRDTKLRIKTNPIPTELEIKMGCFVEMLEPQVRQAVIEINKKGYSTENSGFTMGDPMYQEIFGPFVLNHSTEKLLEDLEVEVTEYDRKGSTCISFYSGNKTLESIAIEWQKIVSLIPPATKKYEPNNIAFAKEFRSFYSSK